MFSIINIELTNMCNKNSCYMCGRRKKEKTDPSFYNKYSKHMDFSLLEKISEELKDKQILIQFHWDGDPTMYPRLGDALKLFKNNIRCFDTNGKLLVSKAEEIIDNLETITISTFENDIEAEIQLNTVKDFLKVKGIKKPNVIIRCLGDTKYKHHYKDMGLLTVDRVFHKPEGSFGYSKQTVIPEHGICLEALMHPAIDVNGDMSLCVRFDSDKIGVIGNVKYNTIEDIWFGEKRKEWLEKHIEGKRNEVPLCSQCEFWGIPRG